MVPIHTKPPSRAYDEGWDAIFGKRPDRDDHVHEVGSCSHCDALLRQSDTDQDTQRAALTELTRLSEEMGGYDTERDTSAPVAIPANQPK